MKVIIAEDYDEMSQRAAQVIVPLLQGKPDAVLGTATGSTPEGLYGRLIRAHADGPADFARVRCFALDEYVGLPGDHPQSYHRFMREKLFDHVNIPPENAHLPDGMAESLSAECDRYEEAIREAGGIDLQVLGIGRDGHIGFNEPGTSLASRTHVAALTRQTIEDNARFFPNARDVPHFAVTMGIGTILEARRCLLLASGAGKAEAVRDAIEGPVSARVAASALQLHPDALFIVDRPAASRLEWLDFYSHQQEIWTQIADRL
jgi:glucosamine-6-phosphate deaminase